MTSPFIAPPALKAGDVIRAIAPSGCFDRQRFDDGVKLIEAAGLTVRFDDGLFSRTRYLAGDDERRSLELARALTESDTQAIWCARGGYGATRIIHNAKADPVRERPRWLIGFSDATPLHALWARAGVMSLHGANIDVIARWSPGARDELFSSLMQPSPRIYRGRTVRHGEIVSGPITGGNLTVLAAMVGTSTLPSMRGAVLFIEDVGERPYRIDRVLTQLVRGGALEGIVGVAVGQLTDCNEPNASYGALDVITDIVRPLGVPVIAELALGHEPETSRCITFGSIATLDAAEGVLTVAKP